MIPKIIHYCWFGGGKLPPLAVKCIESWKKHLPDYEIRVWDETTFNVDSEVFTQQAYSLHKFAYVADYVRLYALYNCGGIYMDTDIELLSSLSPFLHNEAFSGFEDNSTVTTGIIAAKKESVWAKNMLDHYKNRTFILDGIPQLITNVVIISDLMEKKGLILNNTYQEIPNYITYYPSEVFSPKSHETGLIKITKNTVCIHHFAGSWLESKDLYRKKISHTIARLFGTGVLAVLKKMFLKNK